MGAIPPPSWNQITSTLDDTRSRNPARIGQAGTSCARPHQNPPHHLTCHRSDRWRDRIGESPPVNCCITPWIKNRSTWRFRQILPDSMKISRRNKPSRPDRCAHGCVIALLDNYVRCRPLSRRALPGNAGGNPGMATGLKSAIMMSARSSGWRLARSASGLGSPNWFQVSSDSGERAGAYNGRQQSKQGTFRKRSHQ